MKYAIIVGGKVTEPTDVPQSGQADPVAWLNKYRFPGAWLLVSDDALPGATYNGPGSSTNPALPVIPYVPKPIVHTNASMRVYLSGLLNSNPTVGAARLRKILEDAAAKTGATDADYRTRDFKDWFLTTTTFTKDEFAARSADLVTSLIITDPQRVSVLNNWAEA